MRLIRRISIAKSFIGTLAFLGLLCFSSITLAIDSLNVDRYTDIGGGNVNWEQGTVFKKDGFIAITSDDYPLSTFQLTPDTLSQINGKTVMTLANWIYLDNALSLSPFERSAETYSINGIPNVIVTNGKASQPKPIVTISATKPNASESGNEGEFLIALNAPVSKDVVVTYKIKGTAKNRKDYTKLLANTRILAGNVSAVVTVSPVADTVVEGTETLTLILNNSKNYEVGGSNTATVNILE